MYSHHCLAVLVKFIILYHFALNLMHNKSVEELVGSVDCGTSALSVCDQHYCISHNS